MESSNPQPRPRRRAVAVLLLGAVALLGIVVLSGGGDATKPDTVAASVGPVQRGAVGDDRRDENGVTTASGKGPLRPKVRKVEQHLRVGARVGRLQVEKLGLKSPYVQGADLSSLERAPGHYVDTDLPGEGGTVGIAGHRTTFGAPFRKIHRLDSGDEITIDMPYGDFTYAVKRTEIVKPEAVKVLRARRREQVVLTACHPPFSAAQRIVAFGELVAGPTIEEIAVSFGAHPSARGAPPESQS